MEIDDIRIEVRKSLNNVERPMRFQKGIKCLNFVRRNDMDKYLMQIWWFQSKRQRTNFINFQN